MTKPVIFVSGHGRCGTSLMMQMLAVGGMPCVGKFPAFEVPSIALRPPTREALGPLAGHAVKRLDPHRFPSPEGYPYVTIWLDRDPRQQAKSQVKFLVEAAGMPRPSRRSVRALEASLKRDRSTALNTIAGGPIAVVQFERLISEPLDVSRSLAAWLSPWFTVDPLRMASAVLPREPTCLPNIEIERHLMEIANAG